MAHLGVRYVRGAFWDLPRLQWRRLTCRSPFIMPAPPLRALLLAVAGAAGPAAPLPAAD